MLASWGGLFVVAQSMGERYSCLGSWTSKSLSMMGGHDTDTAYWSIAFNTRSLTLHCPDRQP